MDTDFAGSWDKADSMNPENVLSRTVVLWTSNCFCIKIALSTAEAEYIGWEIIPIMNLLKEIKPYMKLDMKDSECIALVMKTTLPVSSWQNHKGSLLGPNISVLNILTEPWIAVTGSPVINRDLG